MNGADYTGGLVGGSSGSIENSYATGSVMAKLTTGGLVGFSDNISIESSYFDTQTTGQYYGVGSDSDATGVTGLTTAEMVNSDTLSNAMSDLDSSIWSKRAATDNYCYYPELTVFYGDGALDTAQKQASEMSVRVSGQLQTIEEISAPEDITSGQSLILPVPTVTDAKVKETNIDITSQGWQISSDATHGKPSIQILP